MMAEIANQAVGHQPGANGDNLFAPRSHGNGALVQRQYGFVFFVEIGAPDGRWRCRTARAQF